MTNRLILFTYIKLWLFRSRPAEAAAAVAPPWTGHPVTDRR
jgi:hypothetical protein